MCICIIFSSPHSTPILSCGRKSIFAVDFGSYIVWKLEGKELNIHWGTLEEKCAESNRKRSEKKKKTEKEFPGKSWEWNYGLFISFFKKYFECFFEVCAIHRKGWFHFWVVSTNTESTFSVERKLISLNNSVGDGTLSDRSLHKENLKI